MAKRIFTITCERDEEAGVWYVSESDVPGLVAEAPTQEALVELLQQRIPELMELNMPELAKQEKPRPPVELLIQHQQRVRLACN